MVARYFTDLTDDQWNRVRSALFSDHPDPDALRRIANAILFRERARVPWSLLPREFPTPSEVQRSAESWVEDGIWASIRERLAVPSPIETPAKRRGLRGTLARLVRHVPGNRFVLEPMRWAIRRVQHFRSRSTPLAKLPAVFAEARRFTDEGEHEAAADRYSHVLDLVPDHLEARLRRGVESVYLRLDVEARNDFYSLLSHPGLDLPWRIQVNNYLAEQAVRLGDFDRAIGHGYIARLLKRYGEDAPWNQAALAEEADEFELLSEVHNDLAEFAINFESDFSTATALYARRDETRRDYTRWLTTVPAQTHYLAPDWVRNIGHIALLDFWVKMRELGWLDRTRIVVHAPPAATANRSYLAKFRPHLKIVADPEPGGGTQHLAVTFGSRVASILRLPGHSEKYFLEGMGLIQEEWERQGREPLLAISEDDRDYGQAKLRAMGMPDGVWFVGVHVRSSGFHGNGLDPYQSHRNADIARYFPLMDEVVRRGGWVIRLGDGSMPPLPSRPGVIDYARSPHKSERLDVFLCGACRFFVGVASGLAHLPTTFGVPCLLTNWLSNALPVKSRHDLFLPKLVWSTVANRLLTFDEYFLEEVRARFNSANGLRDAGLRPVDNTAEELQEAVVEMLDLLDGREPANDSLQERFEALVRGHGLVGFSRIGRDFLSRHASLLVEAEPIRKAG